MNEAIKRKSGRKNGGQIDYHLLGRRTIDIIGEDTGESAKQVQRFMKLTVQEVPYARKPCISSFRVFGKVTGRYRPWQKQS